MRNPAAASQVSEQQVGASSCGEDLEQRSSSAVSVKISLFSITGYKAPHKKRVCRASHSTTASPEPGVTVEDVLEETGKFIGYDNLVSASRMNKDLVNDLTSVGISERRSCHRNAAYCSDNQSHYFKRPAIPTGHGH
ncbi:hypothetical protein QTP86_023318 [Hemibagrus guttatus]|nr:hypothetical protein QTP86_023318 [Hemibagrus guttatus]